MQNYTVPSWQDGVDLVVYYGNTAVVSSGKPRDAMILICKELADLTFEATKAVIV